MRRSYSDRFLPHAAGPKDTPIELAQEKTYDEKAGIGMPDL
jgi:large subunit ribosomal protein L24